MKKIAATLLTLLLVALLVNTVEAAPTRGLPKPRVVTSFPYPSHLDGNFASNQFVFIKLNGYTQNGNTIPLTAEIVSMDFDIFPPQTNLPYYCSFWYTSGYSEPLADNGYGYPSGLYGAQFSSFLYTVRGRSGGGEIQLNPQRKGGGGIWAMSSCDVRFTLSLYGYS